MSFEPCILSAVMNGRIDWTVAVDLVTIIGFLLFLIWAIPQPNDQELEPLRQLGVILSRVFSGG